MDDTYNQDSLLPWTYSDADPFFGSYDIYPERWDKLFPYRLLVVEVGSGGEYKIADSKRGTVRSKLVQPAYTPGVDYIINQQILSSTWVCTLPITPQQIQITDQFAINTSATATGILEEHNGVKFKLITMTGTTGVWPKKPTIAGEITPISAIESAFAGTIEAAKNLAGGIDRLNNAVSGKHPAPAPKAVSPTEKKPSVSFNPDTLSWSDKSNEMPFSTGYYQALYLSQFLERYAMAKKNPDNKRWRLALDVPKMGQTFLVTPIAYTIQKSAQKPNERMYSLQLKAWKRIVINNKVKVKPSELPELTANAFDTMVNSVDEVRRVLSGVTNLISAVRGDIQGVFNVIGQTALAFKDVAGIAHSVADFPTNIKNSFRDSITRNLESLGRSLDFGGGAGGGIAKESSSKGSFSGGSTKDQAKAAQSLIAGQRDSNEGLSYDEVVNGTLGEEATQNLATDPSNEIFNNPEANFEFFNSINIDDLPKTPEQELMIEEELEKASLLTIDDFQSFKKEIMDLALDISNLYGASDPTYSYIYNRPEPTDRPIDLNVIENEILVALFDMIQAYDLITSNQNYDDLSITNSLDFVGGLANESGIDFTNYSSKMLMPVPFGLTIEQIAAKYLGDSSKWLEIVTINGLKSPYIDEDGFVLKLLSNADGRQFNVDDAEERLYIGQRITLQSSNVTVFSRNIIDVEKIGDGNYLITVDGKDDLDILKFNDGASIRGYLPSTVNSQNQIYIPTEARPMEDDNIRPVNHLDDPDLTKISKVDFLLTDDMDLAIDSVGEFRLANGLTNLIQAMKLKIKTRQGSILRHLNYGLGINYGVSIADIESGELLSSLNDMVASDPRYEGIRSASIRLSGSTLSIFLDIKIINNDGIVPISFNMKVN